MADESDKAAGAVPKKSRVGLIIGIVLAVIMLIGGSVAGAVLGPKLLASPESAEGEGKSSDEDKAPKTPPKPETIVPVEFPAMVVDLRDEEGRIRHLKVGLIAELPAAVTADQFKLVIPRGREASVSYLRSLSFEDISDPKKYASIKQELSKRVTEAVGPERVHRILVVDFVSQ